MFSFFVTLVFKCFQVVCAFSKHFIPPGLGSLRLWLALSTVDLQKVANGANTVWGICCLLWNLAAQITTNQRVITYIPNCGVPRMKKFIYELISPFISYGFTMGKLCIELSWVKLTWALFRALRVRSFQVSIKLWSVWLVTIPVTLRGK